MWQGAKYFEWERKGVPLRLEIGQRDAAAASVTLARRTGQSKHPSLPHHDKSYQPTQYIICIRSQTMVE